MNEVPYQIKNAQALRKPEKLPDNASNAFLSDETIEFLNKLKVYEVDGEYLYQEEFPTDDQYYILWDYTTNLAWLADSSGYRYPRYIININPWRPEKLLNEPENMPESISLANRILEMTSSMSMGTAPMAAAKKKKQKVDTPYKGSWADTMKTTDWKKLQPKSNWVRVSNESLLAQSSELICNILSEANDPENLEKNKFEVVCLDASGKEVSTKSFSTEEAAQEHIEKKNEKLDDDEVGCSYKIRVIAKGYKDPFAMEEEANLHEFRGTGKYNFEVPDRPRPRDIEVGDRVRGLMGVHGNSSGVVTKVGPPHSSSGSPTVWVRSEDGKEWDTYAFNLGLMESKLNECQHGDIVRLGGYLKRNGYYKVDTQDALGASEERPWVENLQDPGFGFYVDPSDTKDMEVVISSDEHDTRMINTLDDVENILEFGDVEYDD